ncbi:MAG TPA: iron-sulfur protein, partial [Actinobacteria bacterium]|nr:iron-sulfur protein [Actinomycetota bacterium]
MEKVVAGKCDSYNIKNLKHFFDIAFKEINFKVSHQKILLKPNLLSGKPPEKAVTTNPEFIRAISELLLDFSCDVYIGDSPGYESAEKVLSKSGILDIVKYFNLKTLSFDRKITKKYKGISP